MCITNDSTISNGNERNIVMKKRKCLKKEKQKQKSCNNRGKERKKRWKTTKVATKMKG
jgi:hypothetical protein